MEIVDGKLIISWQDVENDLRLIVEKIKQNKQSYKGLVVVARGGLGLVAILSRLLDVKLIDIICIGSYDHSSNNRMELEVFKAPEVAIKDLGKGWLIVDDVIDSGYTYNHIMSLLPEADFACLYNKSTEEKFKTLVLYASCHPQDTWIKFPWEIE